MSGGVRGGKRRAWEGGGGQGLRGARRAKLEGTHPLHPSLSINGGRGSEGEDWGDKDDGGHSHPISLGGQGGPPTSGGVSLLTPQALALPVGAVIGLIRVAPGYMV